MNKNLERLKKLKLKKFRLGLSSKDELEFPLTSKPKFKSQLHSPRAGNANQLPEFNKDEFFKAAMEVLEVRLLISKGIWPDKFLRKYWPEHWGVMPEKSDILSMEIEDYKMNPQSCANVVHMDKPVDLGFAVMDYLGATGARKNNQDLTNVDFLNRGPQTIKELTERVATALEKAFEAKYYFGIARPEEVLEEITGVKGKLFTEYVDNSYNHPSYPAGHGAAAGATGDYFIQKFDLSEEQKLQVRYACYLWAQFRTFAGVHYAIDNLMGLRVGGLI